MEIYKDEIIIDKKIDKRIRKYGQAKLARQLDVTYSSVCRWLSGDMKMPYKHYLKALDILEEKGEEFLIVN